MHARNRISDPLILALILAGLSGCADSATVDRFPRGQVVGNLGSASEVVFAPTPSYDGWEYARSDDAMNVRSPAEYARDDAERPSLSNLRRFDLQPRPDQVYYFDRPRPARRW